MELSNVLLFWKQWSETPGTGSPNFLISSAEIPVTVSVISTKLLILCLKISHWGNLTCPWSNTIGFIRIGFTILDLWSFSQGDLLQDCSEQRSWTACHVSLVHILSLTFRPQKLKSVPFLGHLQEFHLDLCIPIYCRYPQVSCLWMISGRGWNPNLERSYLPEYSE